MMRTRAQKRNLGGRLVDLERVYAAVANAAADQKRTEDARAAMENMLARLGVRPEGNESKMEALARGLGITLQELRNKLRERAAGVR